jgi:GntR family transcriptional repressor for pyruvate dehydrogenase complex
MNIEPINKKRNYKSIIEQIIALIKSEKLKEGDKLPGERTLAEMFDVSRSSIREAFSALEIIGIIKIKQGEGTFITDINIAPFINTIAPLFVRNENMENELLELRRILEIEAVKLAAIKSNITNLSLMEVPIDKMKNALADDNLEMGALADIEFHKAIFSLTNNYILIKASECIAYLLESSVLFNREKILRNNDSAGELLNQHIEIYNAIKNHNTEIAEEKIKEHINFVLNAGV